MSPAVMETRRATVVLAAPADTISACLDRMRDAKVGSIVVVENDKPVGILTERDVLMRWKEFAKPEFVQGTIGSIATKPVFCLEATSIANAPREMLERGIRHIPLVDASGVLCGMMSIRDVMRAQLKAGTLPTLKPVVRREPLDSEGDPALHLLAPASQISALCQQFLPDGWHMRSWNNIKSVTNLPEMKDKAKLKKLVFLLDLDAVKDEDWRSLIRTFLGMLTGTEQPEIMLVFSPNQFAEKDVASLTAIAAKAKWRAYHRPLAVEQFVEDIQALK